jgi:hypothetical protein
MTRESRYRRHPAVVATELSGEVVALHLDTKRYYTLNATASHIWQALEDTVDESALVGSVLAEFAVEEEEARAHVATLLAQMLEMRLVERCDD